MRAPLTWLSEHVDLPEGLSGRDLAEVLIRAGLEVETVDAVGSEITGPLVVGRILASVDEPQKNGKVIRWVQVDVGAEHNDPHPDHPQGCRSVVCGAHNFGIGDLVVVSLPGTTLAGGFHIAARKTYGHVSDGMICAEDELGIGHDHSGIIVLPASDDQGRALAPGDDPAAVLHLRDEVLDIDVSPDMGYCLSIRGLAREAGQNLGVTFTDAVTLPTPSSQVAGHPVRLDSDACDLFVALTVEGIDPGRPTPRWMARRLVMAGMRSISLTVDVTNYVMLEIGQPLHAYDADALQGTIVVRDARAGESLTTLDGVARNLSDGDLVITDDSGPIGLAGVMGGASTEVTSATTRVVLEAAHFDSTTISRTLRRHNLPSEASKRFHRGVDPRAAYSAAHRAAALLVQLGGGALLPTETVAGQVAAQPEQVISTGLPSRVLGLPVASDRVLAILRASGVEVAELPGTDQIRLVPPSWRSDLRDPFDYVEEVGRKIGFDQLPAIVPPAPIGRGLTRSQRARRAINAALVASGFTEVLTFPFMAVDDADRLEVPATDDRRSVVKLANPLAATQPLLRTTMVPGLLGALTRNTSRGNDDLALFESGLVFRRGAGTPAPTPSVLDRPTEAELAEIEAALPRQPRHLAAVLTGAWLRPGWRGAGQAAGWQQAFAFADVVGQALGVSITRTAAEQAPWHPGRCAELRIGDLVVGYAGELHPRIARSYGVPARTAAVEIDLDAAIAAAPAGGDIVSVSSRPVAKEDLALVVDASVEVAAVQAALVRGAGELLEEISLFDVFTGGQVPQGKKSVAFALRFRAKDRTLTDAETAAAKESALAAAGALGAELRAF